MKKIGATIKLLGTSRKVDGVTYSMVAPFVLYSDNPLYNVKDVFNAILVKGDMLGEVMFYGKGAGSLPTASAVVSDVVDAVKRQGYTARVFWSDVKRTLGGVDAFKTPYFVRVKPQAGEDIASLKKRVDNVFGKVEYISLDSKPEEIAFITDVISGSEYDKAAEGFDVVSRIRVSK